MLEDAIDLMQTRTLWGKLAVTCCQGCKEIDVVYAHCDHTSLNGRLIGVSPALSFCKSAEEFLFLGKTQSDLFS